MRWKYVLVAALVAVSAVALAQSIITTPQPPPPTLPPVIVTAPSFSGTVICRGAGCAAMLEGMRQETFNPDMYTHQPLPEDDFIDDGQFCENLKAQRPAGCNAPNPPASPGIIVPGKPNWQPNGCGTGGMANWFVNLVLTVTSDQAYSGNLNKPYPGVSFQGSCNSHDQCWAQGGGRGTCDLQFRDSMNGACAQLGFSSASATCMGFASTYHGAVSTTNASNSAYANSVQAHACAIWASDMRENSCEN